MIELFAFEADNCAYTTYENSVQAAVNATRSLGILTTEGVLSEAFARGLPLNEIFESVAPDTDTDLVIERFYDYDSDQDYKDIKLFPKVSDILRDLRLGGIGLALVTKRDRESTEELMSKTGLDRLISCVVTSSDIDPNDNFADAIMKATYDQNVSGLNTAFMGPTPGDIVAGGVAGVATTIGFDRVFGNTEKLLKAGADRVLTHWGFLPELIAQINRDD